MGEKYTCEFCGKTILEEDCGICDECYKRMEEMNEESQYLQDLKKSNRALDEKGEQFI